MGTTKGPISGGLVRDDVAHFTDPFGMTSTYMKSRHFKLHSLSQKVELRKLCNGHFMDSKLRFSSQWSRKKHVRQYKYTISRKYDVLCLSRGTRNTEANEHSRCSEDCLDNSRDQIGENTVEDLFENTYAIRGLAEACKYVYNDAKYVNDRARNDIVLLSRGITRLNDRARQDFAILGLEFLKLDARAREDTEKIDYGMKKKAARLHNIAMVLKNKAQTKLKRVADQHWCDGALEADLRKADFCMKRRAMEDAFMALEFVRNIHDMMLRKLYELPRKNSQRSVNDLTGLVTLEKNGRALDIFPGEISTDRITAIQEAYWNMLSALSEADGVDYADPEELELLVATLIDLDAMDGKSSALLLAECSSSPDVNTRKALANALAAAPSMWTLGNAGMGALQRLAEDSNPAVAAAASKAIAELRKQWKIEDSDSWRFTMNNREREDSIEDDDDAENT